MMRVGQCPAGPHKPGRPGATPGPATQKKEGRDGPERDRTASARERRNENKRNCLFKRARAASIPSESDQAACKECPSRWLRNWGARRERRVDVVLQHEVSSLPVHTSQVRRVVAP